MAALITSLPPSTEAIPALTAPASASEMTGAQLPYTGKFRIRTQDAFTRCVLKRESNFHWFSTNRAGGYFGAFQFSRTLTIGSTWMMQPELKATYGKRRGIEIARELRVTPMHKWRPYWQHMAFATVLNWESPGSGRHHWAGGRFSCSLTSAS
jgi:hypothetical protein